MGKPRIHIRPTPNYTKAVNQIGKLFSLWNKAKPRKTVVNNPIAFNRTPSLFPDKNYTTEVGRRQIVLNRYYTEVLSDILAHGMTLPKGVKITSIETGPWTKKIDIFFTSKDGELPQQEFDEIKSELIKAVATRSYTARVPQINFVYDLSASIDDILNEKFKKIERDRTIESDNQEIIKLSDTHNSINLEDNKKNVRSKYEDLDDIKYRGFTAPKDMTHTSYGLDYIKIHDKIGLKLSLGRGESERMLTPNNKPQPPSIYFGSGFVHPPKEDQNETIDTDKRLANMKKFVVLQRKKAQFSARVARMTQILQNDEVTWVLPDKSENDYEET